MPVVGAPSTTAQLILDPVSEDATNVELELTDDNNYGLTAHAYPTPSVAAQWASSVSTEGSVLASQRHENRTITISVDVNGLGALQDLEAKVAKLFREGGTLKRVYSDGREIVFDVLTVSGFDPSFEQLHHFADVTPVTIALECKPYGRGAEETLADHTETTLPVLVFTEASIPGDMPALGRLVIDNDVATDQGMVLWGLQSRRYDSAATAALFYQAESCAMINASAAAGPAGASGSGSNVARTTTLSTGAAGLIYIGTSATAQTHRGTFRIFARAYAPATNTGTVSLQCAWRASIGAPLVTNTAVTLTTISGALAEGHWLLVDLGMVTLPEAAVGSQGWIGEIRGSSTVNGDDLDLDWIMLLPVDESSGQAVSFDDASDKSVLASQSITIRHDGVFASHTGGYWTRPPSYEGDYLLVPPSGPEARTVRVITKIAVGNDVNYGLGERTTVFHDPNIDDLSARLYVTPRYLAVPEA